MKGSQISEYWDSSGPDVSVRKNGNVMNMNCSELSLEYLVINVYKVFTGRLFHWLTVGDGVICEIIWI